MIEKYIFSKMKYRHQSFFIDKKIWIRPLFTSCWEVLWGVEIGKRCIAKAIFGHVIIFKINPGIEFFGFTLFVRLSGGAVQSYFF